jgi:hypothetical protein
MGYDVEVTCECQCGCRHRWDVDSDEKRPYVCNWCSDGHV